MIQIELAYGRAGALDGNAVHEECERVASLVVPAFSINAIVNEEKQGLGRPDFLKWFEETDSRALAARLVNGYEVNGQTAWALLTKVEAT